MKWWIDFNELSSTQRLTLNEIMGDSNSNYWIRGFAGTGKTIFLLHLMEQIAALNPSSSLCYITYTNSLIELVRSIPSPFDSLFNTIQVETSHSFLNNNQKYDFVFIDEVQDIEPGKLEKIQNLATRVYVAGDTDQQIYPNRIDRDEIIQTLHPKERDFIEVYRLTARICRVALAIQPEARLVVGQRAKANPNASVTVVHAPNKTTESLWIWQQALGGARPGEPSVILFTNHKDIYDFACIVAVHQKCDMPSRPRFFKGRLSYENFNEHFSNVNIPLMFIGSSYGSLKASDHRPLVYLMTFHSSKGLDFLNVFIPNMNDGEEIWSGDDALGRRLLFVAVTRSRERLFISYTSNKIHSYLENIPDDCITRIDISEESLPDPDSNKGEEDFF